MLDWDLMNDESQLCGLSVGKISWKMFCDDLFANASLLRFLLMINNLSIAPAEVIKMQWKGRKSSFI